MDECIWSPQSFVHLRSILVTNFFLHVRIHSVLLFYANNVLGCWHRCDLCVTRVCTFTWIDSHCTFWQNEIIPNDPISSFRNLVHLYDRHTACFFSGSPYFCIESLKSTTIIAYVHRIEIWKWSMLDGCEDTTAGWCKIWCIKYDALPKCNQHFMGRHFTIKHIAICTITKQYTHWIG